MSCLQFIKLQTPAIVVCNKSFSTCLCWQVSILHTLISFSNRSYPDCLVFMMPHLFPSQIQIPVPYLAVKELSISSVSFNSRLINLVLIHIVPWLRLLVPRLPDRVLKCPIETLERRLPTEELIIYSSSSRFSHQRIRGGVGSDKPPSVV